MPLKPLYDSNAQLVAWFDEQRFIFNTDMKWIAFVHKDHVFSASASMWLGPIHGYNCLDRVGKVVAWNPQQKVEGTLAPSSPLSPTAPLSPSSPFKPIQPLSQMRPVSPAVGWSALSFAQWIAS